MINLEGAIWLLKAASCLMAAGQQSVKLYKQCKDPKGPERERKPESRGIELGGWASAHYQHQILEAN